MPQIPLFNQSQRLEPSSPVQAISPEGTAGALEGRAAQEFGNAMFKLGNTLDVAAKSTRSAEEKLEAKILSNQYNQELLKAYNTLAAAKVNLAESADGNGAVKRLEESSNKILEPLMKNASSDTVRKMVLGQIGNDLTTTSAKLTAHEYDKREKNVPLLRQEVLNQIAATARFDERTAQVGMMENEETLRKAGLLSEAEINIQIAKDNKAIASEAIRGILDKAAANPNETGATFDMAQKLLRKKYALIFTEEEKEKLSNEITSKRNEHFSFIDKIKAGTERSYKAEVEMNDDKAVYAYTQQLAAAGNDGDKIAAITKRIYADRTLVGSSRNMLLTQRDKYSKDRDTLYEAKFNEDLYLGKMNTDKLLTRLRKDADLGEVSPEKWTDLQKKVTEHRSKENPALTAVKSAALNQIQASWGPDAFDFETKMYKGQNGIEVAQAESDFALRLAHLQKTNDYTAENIQYAMRQTLAKFHKKQPDMSKRLGDVGAFKDIESVKAEQAAVAEKVLRNGPTMSTAEKKKTLEYGKVLDQQAKYFEMQNALKINVSPTNKSKVIGE